MHQKAHMLLERSESWGKIHSARNEWGHPCDVSSQEACCFCALGAIMKCYPDPVDQEGAVLKLMQHLVRVLHVPYYDHDFDHDVITRWNDDRDRTHAEVHSTLTLLGI